MNDKEYIILEIIPSAIDPNKGEIVQLSALKLEGLKLINRFDYRIKDENINNYDLRNMIKYDKDNFTYVDTGAQIMDLFRKWAGKDKLLIIDNEYTSNYLIDLDNEKESIFKYLNLDYSIDVIDKIIDKYNLQSSNYIVDILYEALIYESNNKEKNK